MLVIRSCLHQRRAGIRSCAHIACITFHVFTHHASRITFHVSPSLRALNSGADRSLGHRAERLAGIVLVAVQLDTTEAVGANLDSE